MDKTLLEMTTGPALLLDKVQVAHLTGLGVRSIERLTSMGILRLINPGGMRLARYRRSDVEQWVKEGCPGLERLKRR